MNDLFIKEININDVRNIKNFLIPLSCDKKINLIITGQNGCGKTSLLLEIKKYLNNVTVGDLEHYNNFKNSLDSQRKRKKDLLLETDVQKNEIQLIDNQIRNLENWFKKWGGVELDINDPLELSNKFKDGEFIIAYFGAKRDTKLKTPTGINKIDIKQVYPIDEHAGVDFIQYIVNLKADRSFAKDDNDNKTVSEIDEWFKIFEKSLHQLFEKSNIQLQFDRKSYNFILIEDSKEPYNLNQLSDGYSAILNIVTELIMRMETHKVKSYDVQGFVLIDEIETHLHVELQKQILPFLISFFPRIQFIVTTHSPFVINSIKNTIVCDLEKKFITSDLTGYSYDTIIESYFGSDNYSLVLKNSIIEFEALTTKREKSEKETEKYIYLKNFLNEIPKFISDELAVKLQQIKLVDINKIKK